MNVDEAGRIDLKVPSVKEVLGKKYPEKKFRAGSVSATIWLNEREEDGKKTGFKTVNIERSYTDKDGKWHNTNILRVSDIPKAVMVLNKAYEYLALNEEEE
ncbi:MAG: hypothetical protein ACMXX9_04680 [Candidatus Woesearchaeota archaeon]